MSDQTAAHLAVPQRGPARYARNFVMLAVCELRFPTLFELEADTPPLEFAHALRKLYPEHNLVKSLTVGPGSARGNQAHSFSGKTGWTVTLRSSTLTLECTRYVSFEDFCERLRPLLEAAKSVIDSDFFTRVGLRYQNALPYEQDSVADWINPDLVGALGRGVFGAPGEHSGRVVGSIDGGGFALMHGLGMDARQNIAYILDLDLYAMDVKFDEAMTTIQRLHCREFDLFSWCLGAKAEGYLGRNLMEGTK